MNGTRTRGCNLSTGMKILDVSADGYVGSNYYKPRSGYGFFEDGRNINVGPMAEPTINLARSEEWVSEVGLIVRKPNPRTILDKNGRPLGSRLSRMKILDTKTHRFCAHCQRLRLYKGNFPHPNSRTCNSCKSLIRSGLIPKKPLTYLK